MVSLSEACLGSSATVVSYRLVGESLPGTSLKQLVSVCVTTYFTIRFELHF